MSSHPPLTTGQLDRPSPSSCCPPGEYVPQFLMLSSSIGWNNVGGSYESESAPLPAKRELLKAPAPQSEVTSILLKADHPPSSGECGGGRTSES